MTKDIKKFPILGIDEYIASGILGKSYIIGVTTYKGINTHGEIALYRVSGKSNLGFVTVIRFMDLNFRVTLVTGRDKAYAHNEHGKQRIVFHN